jgi:ABC-type antimicrobial peptide transport system permease subunit
MYYVPYRQQPGSPVVRLVVRSGGDLDALGAQLVQVARAIDPQMRLANVVPFTDIVNRTLVVERLIAHVSTAFAVFGLVIACVGLYGILAFAVVRRTREIGLRIALGARPRSVEWLFLRETVALLLAGFAVGVPAAYVVTRSVSSLLFGLEPGDPMTIAAVMVLLSVTALAASWIPARRAAAIDPMRGLREE